MAINGKLIRVMFDDEALEYQEGETTSTLSINVTKVQGSGTTHKTTKNHGGKKTWSITSELIFSFDMFEKLMELIISEQTVYVYFGNSTWYYKGEAFPSSVRLSGGVGSIVKCSVSWQGTGPMSYTTVSNS